MRAIVASEWLKLRRPGMLGALAAGTLALCVGTVVAVAAAGSGRPAVGGVARPSASELTSSHCPADALGVSSTLMGVILLFASAVAWATEYTHDTLRHPLVWEPRRLRLLTGSWIAVAAAVAASVVVADVIASAVGVVAAGMEGHATSAWFTAEGGVALAAAVGNQAVAAIGWSLFGTVLAVAFRTPAPAIGVGVAYALPVEAILEGVADGIDRWLPGELLTALALGGNEAAGYGAALATLAVYATVTAGLALWAFQRADITASGPAASPSPPSSWAAWSSPAVAGWGRPAISATTPKPRSTPPGSSRPASRSPPGMTRRSRSSSASTVRARTPRAGPRRSYGTTPLSHSRPSRSPATAGQPQRSPPTSSNPASAPPATLDVREPPPGHGAARSLRVAATVLVAAGVAVVLVVQRRRSRRGVRR